MSLFKVATSVRKRWAISVSLLFSSMTMSSVVSGSRRFGSGSIGFLAKEGEAVPSSTAIGGISGSGARTGGAERGSGLGGEGSSSIGSTGREGGALSIGGFTGDLLDGILRICPICILRGSNFGLLETSCLRDNPCRRAMCPRVSPFLTV